MHNHRKFPVIRKLYCLIQINRIITLVLHLTGCHLRPFLQIGHIGKICHYIYIICRFRTCRIERNRLQCLVLPSRIDICKISLRPVVKSHRSDLTHQIRLIDLIVVVAVSKLCICHAVHADIGIIIRDIKESLVTKILSPAILADKCAVSRRFRIKIFLRIVVIPANDHHVMIRRLISIIIIGTAVPVIIIRIACCILHITVNNRFHTAIFVYG